ncbi:MAG: YdhR family protein [Cyanobacteria bacterium P01_F01_bin.86]
MIVVSVKFAISQFRNRQALAEDFANISGMFMDIPGLMRKYFVISEAEDSAGGIYMWESRAAAEACFTENFRLIIEERYGGPPEITYFDCPVVIDNQFHYEFYDLAA